MKRIKCLLKGIVLDKVLWSRNLHGKLDYALLEARPLSTLGPVPITQGMPRVPNPPTQQSRQRLMPLSCRFSSEK